MDTDEEVEKNADDARLADGGSPPPNREQGNEWSTSSLSRPSSWTSPRYDAASAALSHRVLENIKVIIVIFQMDLIITGKKMIKFVLACVLSIILTKKLL